MDLAEYNGLCLFRGLKTHYATIARCADIAIVAQTRSVIFEGIPCESFLRYFGSRSGMV